VSFRDAETEGVGGDRVPVLVHVLVGIRVKDPVPVSVAVSVWLREREEEYVADTETVTVWVASEGVGVGVSVGVAEVVTDARVRVSGALRVAVRDGRSLADGVRVTVRESQEGVRVWVAVALRVRDCEPVGVKVVQVRVGVAVALTERPVHVRLGAFDEESLRDGDWVGDRLSERVPENVGVPVEVKVRVGVTLSDQDVDRLAGDGVTDETVPEAGDALDEGRGLTVPVRVMDQLVVTLYRSDVLADPVSDGLGGLTVELTVPVGRLGVGVRDVPVSDHGDRVSVKVGVSVTVCLPVQVAVGVRVVVGVRVGSEGVRV